MNLRPLLAVALTALLAACVPVPTRMGATGARWHPSANFDHRRPNFVIIHETTNDEAEHSLATLTDGVRKVSAHYLIARDGTLYQLVDEKDRAWHAGVSSWGGLTDLNSASIGIELDNTGDQPFPPAQIDVLVNLLQEATDRHQIPRSNILAHGDVAPGRKVDPSRLFPWRELAARGFGRWCEPAADGPLPAFDPLHALRTFGYDVSRPEAAIAAFRRHFLGDDEAVMGDDGLRMLDCLLRQEVAP